MQQKAKKAKIVDAKIHDVLDLWKDKPKSLRFADTDAVVVTAETPDGLRTSETFYIALKPNGTFTTVAQDRRTRVRRQRFARFLKHYKIAENPEEYDLRKGINEWPGRKVEVMAENGEGRIFVP